MPVIQRFYYELTDGTLVTDKNEIWKIHKSWIESLSPEDRTEWDAAVVRQETLRQQTVESGKLKLNDEKNLYIWKDKEARKNEKPMDPVWEKYFARYLEEAQIKLVVFDEEI